MKHLILLSAVMCVGLSVTSCVTISEDECVAGSWQDIGFRDGENGKSRGKFADYTKTCLQYDIKPDRVSYFQGYDQGLKRYCVYDRGYEQGRSGNIEKAECRTVNNDEYFVGYDEGRIIYEINSEHDRLIERYEAKRKDLSVMQDKLDVEGLDKDEIKRIRKKIRRLENEIEDAKIDIRIFERDNDIPRYNG